jgi:hypothetical protein
MKIILKAFGDMYSKVRDIPESCGNRWEMVLTQPISVMSDYHGNKVSDVGPFDAKCTFEWTGKYYEGHVREYVLVDIRKK